MKWIIWLIIVLPLIGKAQSYDKIVKTVEAGDFIALSKLLNYNSASDNEHFLVPDLYKLHYINPPENDLNKDYYSLLVVETNNTIVFADIVFVVVGGKLLTLADTLVKADPVGCFFKNPVEYNKFDEAYLYYHNRYFNPWENYNTQNCIPSYYGNYCGIVGIKSWPNEIIDSVLITGNDAILDRWLNSNHPVMQAYAVEGFYKLHGAKCTMTDRQLRLIKLIKQSDITISACSGCTHMYVSLSQALERYNFYCMEGHKIQ